MLYTPTQAAAVTGLPLKSVQKAIDAKLVPVQVRQTEGISRRCLSDIALICLRLEAEGLKHLPATLRRRIYKSVIRTPQEQRIRFSDVLLVDVARARKGLTAELSRLRKAERMVVSDPDILSGTPVFRGTRVPVHSVAEMLAYGTSREEILEGYPSLNQQHVQLAGIYAASHPRRGRPPVQPWTGTKPIHRIRRRIHSAA